MGLLELKSPTENLEDLEEGIQNTVGVVWDFLTDFASNPVGTICRLILDFIRTIFDAIQILINSIQTLPLDTMWDLRLAYSYEELVNDRESGEDANTDDNSAGNRDMYTNVREFKAEDDISFDGQKYIYIDGKEKGFSENTEIPVIPVDIYNLAIGNVSLTDINFLTEEGHTEGSAWRILRDIAVTIMHITLYLCAGILITILIWHGVCIVKSSLDNPRAQAEHKEGLKRFCISLLMLVGSIVIVALSAFASDMFLGKFTSKENEYELPIRVNVEFSSPSMDGYSFSTNITGYVRYMAQITDVNKFVEKAVYTFGYVALVLVNVIGGIFMVIRMLVMLLLAIAGPIAAILYAIKIENTGILNYKTWSRIIY